MRTPTQRVSPADNGEKRWRLYRHGTPPTRSRLGRSRGPPVATLSRSAKADSAPAGELNPRLQRDDVTAVDWNGATYAIPKRPFALCRCGASTTKPFCDGTHSRTGFKAAEAAVPGSQDKPATKP
jgi:CDGSH-type Zn-finger protein